MHPAIRTMLSGIQWPLAHDTAQWGTLCADELQLEFGGMISACNQVADKEVTISVSAPCLWISTLKDEHG